MLAGVAAGLVLTAIVAVLTFIAHRKLPYRKMLVFTGFMLGVVLLVMVGEQAQEMQLAHWLPTTTIPSLEHLVPGVDGAVVLGVPDGGDARGAGARGGDRARLVLHRAPGHDRAHADHAGRGARGLALLHGALDALARLLQLLQILLELHVERVSR